MRVPCPSKIRLAFILAFLAAPTALAGQEAFIQGRVTDQATGEAVRDATVTLLGTNFIQVTDVRGIFRFPQVPIGEYRIQVTHLAYGEHTESVVLEDADEIALRIMISQQAIKLDPVVVEVMSRRELDMRSRGTMIQEVTREELERAARTSLHLGDVLRQTVPGLAVRNTHGTSGGRICVEFRGRRSIRFALTCQTPVLLLDGVRMYDPGGIYSAIEVSSIERIEVVPPSEAGLLYGSDSAFGVLKIETKVWAEKNRGDNRPASRRLRGGVYDWTLETESHSWQRTFLAAAAGSALGVVTGLAVAGTCIDYDELAYNAFASKCDTWGTVGSWAAAITFPLLAGSTAAGFAGATPLSKGKLLPAVAAGALALVPAYALASSAHLDGVSPTTVFGALMLGVGVPTAITVADRLFRKFRGS